MKDSFERITEYDPTLLEPISEMLEQLTARKSEFCEQQLRQIIECAASELFILRVENHVAAMITVGYYPAPSGAKAWIEDVVVLSQYRGRGLARKMVALAIDFCRENYSPCTLMLTSNPARIAANELYRTSGFEQKITNVYKMQL